MTIEEAFEFIQFWVNKKTGAWFTVSEITSVINRGQTAYYSDIKPFYATSQLVKDTLAPFREVYNFTTLTSGYVIVPDDNYLDLLDLQIYFQVSNRTVYYPVQMINEDARATRLNSQVDPVTITSPIGEQVSTKTFRLYPAASYNGNVTYLRKPADVVFGYTVISGRVIVYNPLTSVQFEWKATDIVPILLKGLESIGINLLASEVSQFAAMKTADNFQNINRL